MAGGVGGELAGEGRSLLLTGRKAGLGPAGEVGNVRVAAWGTRSRGVWFTQDLGRRERLGGGVWRFGEKV